MGVDLALVLARFVFYGAATILFGSSLFPLYARLSGDQVGWALPRARASALALAGWLAAGTWLLRFAGSLGETDALTETLRTLLFESSFGPPWLLRLGGMTLALGAALAGRARLVLAGALAALASEASSGHAAAWDWGGLLAQAVHVVCAAAWLGGLLPLWTIVLRARENVADVSLATSVLHRFSRFGMVFVAGIALTGAINTWQMLHGVPDLRTGYGRVLLMKIALFGLMVGLAIANRYWLVARIGRADPGRHLIALSRSIAAEQVCGAAVLLAVSALGLIDPRQ